MIFSFKNGYKVKVTDTEGKTKKECYDIAKKLVGEMEKGSDSAKKGVIEKPAKKDAVDLSSTVYTHTAFSPKNLKDFVKEFVEKDKKNNLVKEVSFLKRDLEADASELHKNYVDTYRRKVLDKIVDEYTNAIDTLKKAEKLPEEVNVAELDALLKTILENWGYTKKAKDAVNDGKKYLVLVSYNDDLLYVDDEGDLTPHERYAKAFDYEKDAYEAGKASGLKFRIIAKEDRAFRDSEIKDVPAANPGETFAIKNPDVNMQRLIRELVHNSGEKRNLSDYDDVVKELDELIAKGKDFLTEKGLDRLTARESIRNRYDELIESLQEAGEKEKANEIMKKVVKLKQVWDLSR